MRTLLCVACAALLATVPDGWCRVVSKPDANTLWIEDGTAVETGTTSSPKSWSTAGLDIETAPGGGILFRGSGPKRYAGGRYMPMDPAYPWLVWEMTGVRTVAEGYRAFGFHAPTVVFGFVSHIYPGRFVANPFAGNPKLASGMPWWTVYLYNTEVTMPFIKMVKKPDYLVEMLSPAIAAKGRIEPGDEVTVRVAMDEPAEDVTVSFFDSYITHAVSLNGVQRLQLKPADKEQKVWSASLTVADAPDKNFAPGSFLLKATILGGGLKVPLWTANPCELRFKKEAK